MSPNEIFDNLNAGHKLQIKGWHPSKFIHKPCGTTIWNDGTRFTEWDSYIPGEWVIRSGSFLEVMAAAKPYESVRRRDWPPMERIYLTHEGQWNLANLDFLTEDDLNSLDWYIFN